MKEKRGLFQSIFGKAVQKIEEFTTFRLLNTFDSSFTPFSGNEWDIAAVRSAVNAFARHAAKVTPKHIRRGDGTYSIVGGRIDRILQFSPNPYMSAYACYYKVAVNYKLTNNAFIYPVWDEEGRLKEIYPIMAQKINLVEYKGELFCQFKFTTGKEHFIPYSEIIHIRSHFYDNDIFGSNNRALMPVLTTAHTFNQSMSKFAELISIIRGVLKVSSSTKNEDLNKRRDSFVRDNMMVSNNGSGIIVTDAKYDYVPMTDKSTPIPQGQLQYIKNEIYDYIGVNEKIVQNKFTEEEWNAFYEGELEAFFIQLSQEFTNCLFTEKERGFGNEIIAEANRLQYASVRTKISAGTFLTNIGAASLDQILEIFNMAPIGGEEGKRRVQTLNMVNAKIIDKYQNGTVSSAEGTEESETEEDEDDANKQKP